MRPLIPQEFEELLDVRAVLQTPLFDDLIAITASSWWDREYGDILGPSFLGHAQDPITLVDVEVIEHMELNWGPDPVQYFWTPFRYPGV